MRCKCCDVPLEAPLRQKYIEELDVWVEEDFCNKCIADFYIIEYSPSHSYQFEDITENIMDLLKISEIY